MAAGEEVVGDQAEGDVVHMSFEGTHMFGCYEVDGGRLELGGRSQRTGVRPVQLVSMLVDLTGTVNL